MHQITSPVPEFPGYVEFPDFLTLPQVVEYSRVSNAVKGTNWEHQQELLPVQLKLTGRWSIAGLPEKPDAETFPFTPALPASRLLSWLHVEFVKMIVGETEIPNDSSPRPTDTPKTPDDASNPQN